MSDSDAPLPLIRTGLRDKLPRGLSHPVGAEAISRALAGCPRYDELCYKRGRSSLQTSEMSCIPFCGVPIVARARRADMVSADTKAVIERAKRIYADQLQATLEPRHRNRFVAIEPESGEYFLGDTFDEAVKSAREKHPTRLSHTIRIGHRAAFTMGGMRR